METEKEQITFEQVFDRGCGLDVHMKDLVATIRGKGIKQETRTFSSFTESIEELRDWLKAPRLPMLPWKVQGYTGNLFLIFWNNILRLFW